MDTAFGTPPWLDNRAEDFQKELETIKAEVKDWLGDLNQLGKDTLKCNIDYADIIWDATKKHTDGAMLRDAVYEEILQEMYDLGW